MSESKSRSKFKRPSTAWLSIAGVTVLAVIAGLLVGIALTRPTPQIDASVPLYTIPPEPTVTPSSVVTVTRTAEPLKVLFVGGALTNSVSASADSKGFRSTMVRELRKTGTVMSTKMLYPTGSATSLAKIAGVATNQDIAVVQLGPDDVGASNIETFTSSYKAVISTIVEASPEMDLVCTGVWQASETADKFDAVIAKQCEAHGGVFRALKDLNSVDANRAPAQTVQTTSDVNEDGQPNDVGYAAIAERLLAAIEIS